MIDSCQTAHGKRSENQGKKWMQPKPEDTAEHDSQPQSEQQ